MSLPPSAQAIANLSGSNFFDISPRNTDGKYPGKNVAMMIHMVFKVRGQKIQSISDQRYGCVLQKHLLLHWVYGGLRVSY